MTDGHNPAPPTVPAPLRAGPLDVVGDIHGELEALHALLDRLGYDPDGVHTRGRSLVFVGDLCDRGPDSPGVIRLVMDLVAAGRAQCLMGNHELNLLRGATKPANGWFFAEDHDRKRGRFLHSQPATAADRAAFPEFFATLPLALERADLRVVHAAWHGPSLREIGTRHPGEPVLQVYQFHAAATERWARSQPVVAGLKKEYEDWGRHMEDENVRVPLLTATGTLNEHFQMANPVRVLTSGVERLAAQSFFASGKWRMVNRVDWWRDYVEEVPVIFGHYWRWYDPGSGRQFSRGEADLFTGAAPNHWLGPSGNAFCVDFSVGVRYRERIQRPGLPFLGRLAAVRWPEQELVFDDGETLPLVAPG